MEKAKNKKQPISIKIMTSITVLMLMLIISIIPTHNERLGSIEAEAAGNVSIDPTLPSPAVNAPFSDLLSAVKFDDMVSLHLGGALLDDQGAVWMWGYNAYGMQAIGIPQDQGGTARYNGGMKRIEYFLNNNIEITSIEGAYRTMYAIGIDHNDHGKVKVYAWGNGAYGQMGNGIITAHNNLPVEVKIPSGEEVVELYAGVEVEHAVFARCKSGNIYGWGYGRYRALTTEMVPTSMSANYTGYYVHTPCLIESLTTINKADPDYISDTNDPNYDPDAIPQNIVSMSIGTYHGILATKDGKAYSWGQGFNSYGQVGQGNAVNYLQPTVISALSSDKIIEVDASTSSSLVLTENGTAYHFGLLYHLATAGQNNLSPVAVGIDNTSAQYIPKFVTIENGRYAMFAVDQYGRIWSWGYNLHYQWATDGPMNGAGTAQNVGRPYVWTTPRMGTHSTLLSVATQVPKTLGDGDVEEFNNGIQGPVFSGYDAYNTTGYYSGKATEWRDCLNHWFNQGSWSDLNGAATNRHPTIYDKKYYQTDKEPGRTLAILADGTVRTSAMEKLHSNVFFIDEQGRKLVYVVRKDSRKATGTAASSFTYSGDFYVATDQYTSVSTNKWYVDMTGTSYTETSSLPAGVTEETSVPAVKEEERAWIENATGETPIDFTGTQRSEVPYVVNIETYQSNILVMDNAGNTYRSALDGSGTIAWGWDWEPAYDWAGMYHDFTTNTVGAGLTGVHYGHEVDGLYDMYNHELMFLRGSPRISPTYVRVSSPNRKIYKSEADQEQDTSVRVVLGTATVDKASNITIEPELTQAKYLVIPYDENDPRMNQAEVTQADFNAAYTEAISENWQYGDLIDLNKDLSDPDNPWNNPKNTSDSNTLTLVDNSNIIVTDNCILWVLTVTSGYSANVASVNVQKYDNYYTDTVLYHDGENVDDPYEKIYEATNKYVAKTSALVEDENPDIYGIPLDKNGVVIGSVTDIDPTFGYDEVSIRAFEAGDLEYDQYINGWYLLESNLTPVAYTLDDLKYMEDSTSTPVKRFIHTFYYERDPTGWVTITYRGRYLGTSTNISPFDMKTIQSSSEQIWFINEYQETVRKTTTGTGGVTITLERVPVTVSDAQVVYYTVDGTQKSLNNDGKLEFDTISGSNTTMEVIIYYGQAELYARQMIYDSINDVLIPSEGYFKLNLTNGTTIAETFNMLVNSGDEDDTVAFKKVLLTTDVTNQKFQIDPVLPSFYEYYGYKVSTTEGDHDSATINTTDDPVIDYAGNSKYYVTIYLTPTVNSGEVPFYNWDYKLNEFGEILR